MILNPNKQHFLILHCKVLRNGNDKILLRSLLLTLMFHCISLIYGLLVSFRMLSEAQYFNSFRGCSYEPG